MARFEELLEQPAFPVAPPAQRYEELLDQPALPGGLPEVVVTSHAISRPDLITYDQWTGDPQEKAVLIVRGQRFEEWESVWIQWNWNDPYARFKFTCAELDPYPKPAPAEDRFAKVMQFIPGDECEIFLGGILVIRGLILSR